MLKRLFYMLRNRKALLSQIILPAVFVSISMTIALSAPKNSDPNPLVMSTAQYYDLTFPEGNFIPFSIYSPNMSFTSPNNSHSLNFSRKLAETFFLPSGIGASCVLKANGTSAFRSGETNEINADRLSREDYSSGCEDIFTADGIRGMDTDNKSHGKTF